MNKSLTTVERWKVIFDGWFRKLFALIIFIGSGAYVYKVSFIPVENLNEKVVDTVIGFILGTAFATLIQFFFGSSQSSQDKDKKLINGGPNV